MRIAVRVLALLALGIIGLPGGAARAADYPVRPIHWIVPYPPGGTTDVLARNVAAQSGAAYGQFVAAEAQRWKHVVEVAGIPQE